MRRQQIELDATGRRLAAKQADLEVREGRVVELYALEARVSLEQRRATEAREATDAARRRLQVERATFQRQQA